ncbi:MAG: CoA pyrophosphatase [Myxococcales bacterium]|nr:CoA pyrophosphatase [Myxococcales bacterium]
MREGDERRGDADFVALRRASIRARLLAVDAPLDAPPGLRLAGVLVALRPRTSPPRDPAGPDELTVLLLERAASMRHHAGQLALPGGAHEPGDRDLVATALREAHEEVGLPRERAEVLGRLTSQPTSSGFWMVPVVAWISGPWIPRPGETGEAAAIVEPTLARLAAPSGHRVREPWTWRGQTRARHELLVGEHEPPVTGATGRTLWELLSRLSLVSGDPG